MNAENILSKTLSLLRAKTNIGGLEISDTDLRFAYLDSGILKTAALRLPPGIIEEGEIRNYDALVEALKKLRELVPDDFGKKKIINAIVTLSSIHIYTQVFALPLIEDENMSEAIQLNIRMVSPFDLSQAYAGWQFINRDRSELKVEILSAFAQKTFIDRLRDALAEAGFFALAVESGTLSIARLIREKWADFKIEKPLLIVSVDDKGFRFLIIRIGQLHFEYFQSWKDIQGEAKEVSWGDFEEAIKRNLHQVLNFYGSHWQEPLTDAVVASNSLVEEISKIVRENFSLNIRELKLDQSLRREWYEVTGAAVRGEIPRSEDEDVNLFGVTVQEEFRQQETSNFLKFWQVLLPASLAVMALFMVGGYVLLLNVGKSIETHSSFKLSDQQAREIGSLETKIKDFNASVAMLSGLQKTLKPKTRLFDRLTPLMNQNEIVIDRLYFQAVGLPLVLSGETYTQDQILNFKNAMAEDPFFSSVNLNLSDIKTQTRGFSFALTFGVK